MNFCDLITLTKKSKRQLCKELRELFRISQPSIWEWTKKGIPKNRIIDIWKYYKLDPKLLVKK